LTPATAAGQGLQPREQLAPHYHCCPRALLAGVKGAGPGPTPTAPADHTSQQG
jgi:hypothetical protein